MPEILEIDDDEAKRMQQEADEKRAQEEKEHAQALADADRRRAVDAENKKQRAARAARVEEKKQQTAELMQKLGKVDLEDDDNPDFLFTMPKENKNIDVKSLGYEIFVSEEKGRGIKAARDFKVGNLILKAEPFAFVIFDHMAEHVCHHCFNMVVRDRQGQPTTQLLRCSSCKFARYCSRECQKKAWSMHKKECMAIKRIAPRTASDEVRMVSQILWKQAERGEKRAKSEELCRVEELCDHLNDMSFEDVNKLEEQSKEIGDYFGYENLPDSDEYIDHLFGIVSCNGMSITDMRGLQYLGVAIHPTLNLINHDCNPNVVAVSCGPNIFVRAIKPIKEGDELFISYIDTSATSETRKNILKDQYYFDCTCKMCESGEKDELKSAYVMPKEDVSEKRSTYIEKNTDIMMKKIESSKKVQAWERVAAQAGGCLLQQENLFDDTHLKKLMILQTCSEVSAILNHYDDAAQYAERVLAAYEQLYPEYSTQIGMQAYRLGVHYWHLQRVEDAIKMLGRALKHLEITHGPEHGMYQDGLEMMKTCLQERQMDKATLMRIRVARERMGQGKEIDMANHVGNGPINWTSSNELSWKGKN